MRQQAMEMHKPKAIESAQPAADLKLHLEKYHAQVKEMQITVAEKTSSLEAEAFKTKRLQVRNNLVDSFQLSAFQPKLWEYFETCVLLHSNHFYVKKWTSLLICWICIWSLQFNFAACPCLEKFGH